MKRIFALLVAAMCLAGLAGCGTAAAKQADDGRLKVVATIFPQYDFAREIAGDRADITLLLTPGAESHSYDPSPQDILTIQDCDVFIHVGGGSDAWVERILESMDTSGMRVLALADLVNVLPQELVEGMEHVHAEEEAHDGHDHGAEDPGHGEHAHEETHSHPDEHVWTSPVNAQAIVRGIGDALCGADPDNAAFYAANTATYIEELAALDAAFRAVADGAVRKTLVFGDRFPFLYFTEAYGLDYYAAFTGCSTGTACSASTIAFLIDKVREDEIPVVFYIEMSNQQAATAICEDTGALPLLLHSCHNLTRDELDAGEGYLSLMEKNVEALKTALW